MIDRDFELITSDFRAKLTELQTAQDGSEHFRA